MLSTQLTTRDIPVSAALEEHIRKKTEKLSRFYNHIINCHVVIEQTQKHKHQGRLYNIRIDIAVPGKKIVVTHKHNEDVYVAIRDAFNAAIRRLEEHSRKRHGHVKSHNHVQHGHISRMVTKEGYGFIQGVDGSEYYFSITNVSYPVFERLLVGDAVEFTPEALNDGWQAHHVVRERHNHHEEIA